MVLWQTSWSSFSTLSITHRTRFVHIQESGKRFIGPSSAILHGISFHILHVPAYPRSLATKRLAVCCKHQPNLVRMYMSNHNSRQREQLLALQSAVGDSDTSWIAILFLFPDEESFSFEWLCSLFRRWRTSSGNKHIIVITRNKDPFRLMSEGKLNKYRHWFSSHHVRCVSMLTGMLTSRGP